MNLIYVVYALNIIITIYLVFFDRKSSAATLAWIMVLFLFPYGGLILYFLFSQNIARRKIYKVTDDITIVKDYIIEAQKSIVKSNHNFNNNSVLEKWIDLVMFNLDYSDSLLTNNDCVNLLYDGKEMFRSLCQDIKNAKYSIKLEYYIIRDDEVGTELIDLLTLKAREGVKVKLLLDALGSRSITNHKLSEFKEAGGEYAFFFKPLFRYVMLNFKYINHRKIAIIDNEIGYIGGFNIAREYLGYKKKFGYWRDTHIVIRGNSLIPMNSYFYLDWNCATGYSLTEQDYQDTILHTFRDNKGQIPIQIVGSGPTSNKEEIKLNMMKMISGAKKNIYIQTPYLVPDEPMIESLCVAARSGVDVNIMIPCMPDHPFVYRTTLYNAGRLIAEGANIHIYENGFLHAKTMTVDDEICTVGSCNFDIRSFKLNFEANAIIYDKNTTMNMNNQYKQDFIYCRKYTIEDRNNISLYEKVAESISRLLAEIL